MHSTAVPVEISQWFAMPVDGNIVFFTNSFKKITSYPDLVACLFSALGKNLEFPLTCSHFCVDAFYVQAGIKTGIQVFFYNVTAIGIAGTNRTVVWTLRGRKTTFRETQRLLD